MPSRYGESRIIWSLRYAACHRIVSAITVGPFRHGVASKLTRERDQDDQEGRTR